MELLVEHSGDSHATRCRALWCGVINQVIIEKDYSWFRRRDAETVFALAGFNPEYAKIVGARLEKQEAENAKRPPKPKPEPIPANLELARFIDGIKDSVTTKQEAIVVIGDAGFRMNGTRRPSRERHVPRLLRANGLPGYIKWFKDLA
ncbi:hypothetical protein [Ruegeria arenilitoris]|uniref:hypothetical protein n=1 Tax=Ruegeria arenilitoris TaxID=1173585 RepID=UPI00147BE4AD|nr:hypothetical protein [Ruegeria arenilitoris]